MFGTLRCLLAFLVLLSHFYPGQVLSMKYQVGVAAVIGFFMISGYVMGHLFAESFAKRRLRDFYAERLLRILPQYYFYLIITQICVLSFKFWFFHGYFTSEFSLIAFVLNVLLIPVNYFFWIPEIGNYLLIPQAWSLGLEEQFYLLFPLLFMSKWFSRAAVLVSMVIFAMAAKDIIPSEIFSFRTLPGVLFVFVLGKSLALYQRSRDRESLYTMIVIYAFAVIMAALMYDRASMEYGRNRETLSAIIFGFPLIAGLSLLPRRKWDDFIGKASYGIFLNHILVYNVIQHYEIFMRNYLEYIIAGTVISTVAAYASYCLVEAFADRLRHRLRSRF